MKISFRSSNSRIVPVLKLLLFFHLGTCCVSPLCFFSFFHRCYHLVFRGKTCCCVCSFSVGVCWLQTLSMISILVSDSILNGEDFLTLSADSLWIYAPYWHLCLAYWYACPCCRLQSREHSTWLRRPEKRGKASVSFHELRQEPLNCVGSCSEVPPFLGNSADQWLVIGLHGVCVCVCVFLDLNLWLVSKCTGCDMLPVVRLGPAYSLITTSK